MQSSSSGGRASKRKRVVENDDPETTAMCWEKTTKVPNGGPANTNDPLTSSRFGQHSHIEPREGASQPSPTDPWARSDPFQRHENHRNALYNRDYPRPVSVASDLFPNRSIPTNAYVPPMASFSRDLSKNTICPRNQDVPLVQARSSTRMQISNIIDTTPVHHQEDLAEPAKREVLQCNEIHQYPLDAIPMSSPAIEPAETVCVGVVG